MKIHSHPFKPVRGSTLLATALLAVVVAGTLAAYLITVQNEYTQVSRSQTWNKTLMVTEAGVEEALAFMNKYEGSLTQVTNWSTTASATADGWSLITDSSSRGLQVFHKRRDAINGDSTYAYDVNITNVITIVSSTPIPTPTILSVGSVKWSLNYASAEQPMLAQAGVGATTTETKVVRKIVVNTTLDTLLPGSLVAISTIDFKGNNVTIDSFNSQDPLHSDWQTNYTYQGSNYGFYPFLDAATKREANAVVATDGNILNVGNGNVYGYVDTAPGGTASIKNNGTVGDLGWIGTDPTHPANTGIQTGHTRDDMNSTFPDVILPVPSGGWGSVSQPAGGVTIGGVSYTYVISAPGNYEISSTLQKSTYVASPNVTLYLPGGMNLKSGNTFTVGTNADVTIYSGDSIGSSGQGTINNVNQTALALSIYGLPPGVDANGDTVNGCTSITAGGNSAATSYVYAPEASLTFSGGGSTVYDEVGAYIVHDITINGHFNFHYDQALRLRGPGRGFIPVSWAEVLGQ